MSKGNDFFNTVGTKGGGKDKLDINQDITVYVGDLSTGDSGSVEIPDGRLGYLHNSMIGTIKVNESKLEPGDGLKITGPETIEINAESDSRLILFDMAP